MNIENEQKIIKKIAKDFETLDPGGLRRVALYMMDVIKERTQKLKEEAHEEIKIINELIEEKKEILEQKED